MLSCTDGIKLAADASATCIDYLSQADTLDNLFNGYYALGKVGQLQGILRSLKIVRECFEDIFSDKSIRHEINDQVVVALRRSISRASTFYQRVLVCAYVLWFGDWKSAYRIFLAFGGLFLPNSIRNGGRRFLKLLGCEV